MKRCFSKGMMLDSPLVGVWCKLLVGLGPRLVIAGGDKKRPDESGRGRQECPRHVGGDGEVTERTQFVGGRVMG
jgi:hypothetical protein